VLSDKKENKNAINIANAICSICRTKINGLHRMVVVACYSSTVGRNDSCHCYIVLRYEHYDKNTFTNG
jgi:hypothetical protein